MRVEKKVTFGAHPMHATCLAILIYLCYAVKLLFNRCVSGVLLMCLKMVIFIGRRVKDGILAGAIRQGVIIIIHKEL